MVSDFLLHFTKQLQQPTPSAPLFSPNHGGGGVSKSNLMRMVSFVNMKLWRGQDGMVYEY